MILGLSQCLTNNQMNIKGLQIEKDIIPLFDFTLNDFSKSALIEIFNRPLASKVKIYERQEILKGFTFNHNHLKNYGYSVSYLTEVFYFLQDYNLESTRVKRLNYYLFTPNSEKIIYQNKLTQLILLFDKLQSTYFSKLNLTPFPKDFRQLIKSINNFFDSLKIKHFGLLVREQKFKTKHIVELTEQLLVQKTNEQIALFWNNLFQFEAYLSINKGIVKHNFVFSEISENNIALKNFYYPLIENPILNTFETSSKVIVLTGPNMSGKSTFLRAFSLCTYLAQLGIAIPATKSKIPLYSDISIAINHKDDIKNGYSHFMTEVVNLKKVTLSASSGVKCFAVFDELFSGTNVEDALEICTTTINGLSKFTNSLFFISTHLQQLEDFIDSKDKRIETYHIECLLQNNIPIFSYKLKAGWSNLRVGRILFNKEGLAKLLS